MDASNEDGLRGPEPDALYILDMYSFVYQFKLLGLV